VQAHVPAPGDVLWIREQRWRVERARRDHDVVRLDVCGRHGTRTFLAPFDRPRALATRHRLTRVRPQCARARLAGILARHAREDRALPSAIDARIRLLPYQFEPPLAILRGSARRILIADGVGLGKTIQAGLIVAELVRRDPSIRALIAVPSSLRHQWRNELRAHFSIEAALADATTLDDMARDAPTDWAPWDRAGVWIGSIDYLKQPHVLRDAARGVWDVLVVDEAHGVSGDSERHAAADALGRCARRVVLLSATPHDGHDAHFQRLLQLGALDLPGDALRIFRRTRADAELATDRRVRRHRVRLTPDETRVLDALAAFDAAMAAHGARPEAALLVSVFRKRALSTMGAVARSIARRLAWLDARLSGGGDAWRQARLLFDDADDVGEAEQAALTTDSGLPDAVERSWLRRIDAAARRAARDESRIRRLLTFVRRCGEPIAIFTEFRDSLNVLLPKISSMRVTAVLHGGLPPGEQQRQIERFLAGHATVLLATDVASQGLNLQSGCRCVLNLELPWNPSKIEQRAGRVDRIGQRRRVHVELFAAMHPAERYLLARFDERSHAARMGLDDAAHVATAHDANWSRLARAVARHVGRQRALAARWPGPDHSLRPFETRLGALPCLRQLAGGGSLLVFAAPLVNGLGDAVERHVVCVRDASGPRADRADVTAAAAAVARRLATRVRRLRARRLHEQRRASRVERAIADARPRHHASGELQPGLFDRRAINQAADAAGADAEIRAALDRRLEALEAEASIQSGTPALVAVLRP
jgi:superfamily II DNA or RNA helicase